MFERFYEHTTVAGTYIIGTGGPIGTVAVRRHATGGRPRYTATRLRKVPAKARLLTKRPSNQAVKALIETAVAS